MCVLSAGSPSPFPSPPPHPRHKMKNVIPTMKTQIQTTGLQSSEVSRIGKSRKYWRRVSVWRQLKGPDNYKQCVILNGVLSQQRTWLGQLVNLNGARVVQPQLHYPDGCTVDTQEDALFVGIIYKSILRKWRAGLANSQTVLGQRLFFCCISNLSINSGLCQIIFKVSIKKNPGIRISPM